jgi:hypothetical protein
MDFDAKNMSNWPSLYNLWLTREQEKQQQQPTTTITITTDDR